MWGTVLKRDLLGETREEDKIRSKEQLREYLEAEVYKQGENVVIRDLDVSLIEDLSGLFRGIGEYVKTLDLSGWKTYNVKSMNRLFYCCSNLESLDLSGWDTSNVNDMSWMFFYCGGLKSLDLSGWDTSKVIHMSGMFSYCKSLESLDLSGWDISNVVNMGNIFYDCPAPYRSDDNKIIKI